MNRHTIDVIFAETPPNIREFIDFPRRLFAGDPNWTPSLRLFDILDFRFRRSALLRRSQYVLLLAKIDRATVGRMIVYIDPRVNEHFESAMGYFGAFDIVDDTGVAEKMFAVASRWLVDRGMTVLRGPIDPDSQCWGFVVEGFDTPAVFMSPYSKRYYDSLMTGTGFIKAMDLLAYEADPGAGFVMPERYRSFVKSFESRRPEITTRRINPRRLAEDANTIRELLNAGVAGNWGYVPVDEQEMTEIVAQLKLIYDPEAIWFVLDSGRPVGCALGFPDPNILIRRMKGRLFPTGFLTFLLGRRSIRDYRIWGFALLPEYHGLGLDVLLYMKICSALVQSRGKRLEASVVLENNYRMRNALVKLGFSAIKKYRVYERDLTTSKA